MRNEASSKARALVPRSGSRRNLDVSLVVGIGASAGGLEVCSKLLDAIPFPNGMAFILVQHLDPSHDNLMAGLLAGHTGMVVEQAIDGMLIQPDHLYVIPPGRYLACSNGSLKLSQPLERHGARLPFDFLLQSLATEFGKRAACVILSGTGTDGTVGATAIKEIGGLVVAQEPGEAGYDGMPRSAIIAGVVAHVIPVAQIPVILMGVRRHAKPSVIKPSTTAPDWLRDVIELLRIKTSHDFTLYKKGTLQRRVERRMGLAGLKLDETERYLAKLLSDTNEIERLSKDLLINVTNFFRDPKVFEALSQTVIPSLLENHKLGHPLRIWIAGCSTGEEAYCLAMLFREHIVASKRDVQLQVFASDVDVDAVALAREGRYGNIIEADVSPARLARFFEKDEHGYKVTSELRATVVFTVQKVIADPRFSRLDLISCRNLLIYLGSEAYNSVITLFHFALRSGRILLLGSAEPPAKAMAASKLLRNLCRYTATSDRALRVQSS